MEKKLPDPLVYTEILRELLENEKESDYEYKRAKIDFELNFRWWNPFTWKYYFQFKKLKENNGVYRKTKRTNF